MSLPVLTAVTDRWESALVSALGQVRGEVTVVRRCVDVADLLAAAASGQARAVLVSADLRRLDGEALARLDVAEVAVVGLVEPGDEGAERRLRQLGVVEVLAADAAPGDVAGAVTRAVAARTASRRSTESASSTAWSDPARALDRLGSGRPGPQLRDPLGPLGPLDPLDPLDPLEPQPPLGRIIAVWGPTGAPGRTTVAVTLAAELAALGQETLLADADTYGGCVAQVLGLLDEAPGLAAAVRAADLGGLDRDQLSRFAPSVGSHLSVLTGLVRPDRWPELRAGALAKVLTLCRAMAEWTVVDCGFGLEQDEEIAYDTVAPRRNGATLTVLEQADIVVAVGSGDPVGLQRLVRGLGDLAELRPAGERVVVVNRVRDAAVGGPPRPRIRSALARYAGVADPVLVPDDRDALDAAVLTGRPVTESAPRSAARRAIAELARGLGEAPPGERRAPRPGTRRRRKR